VRSRFDRWIKANGGGRDRAVVRLPGQGARYVPIAASATISLRYCTPDGSSGTACIRDGRRLHVIPVPVLGDLNRETGVP
jgi:hypothetical protein